MNNTNQPVVCGLHSEYEPPFMRRDKLQLTGHDAGGSTRAGLLQPVNLRTRNGAHFPAAARVGSSVRASRPERMTRDPKT